MNNGNDESDLRTYWNQKRGDRRGEREGMLWISLTVKITAYLIHLDAHWAKFACKVGACRISTYLPTAS